MSIAVVDDHPMNIHENLMNIHDHPINIHDHQMNIGFNCCTGFFGKED